MTATNRRRLPNRRPNETHEIEVDGQYFTVTVVGLFPDGTIGEVFIAGPKVGSGMDAALQDAAILASLALQYGTPPAALATSMSRQPTSAWEPATAPASPVGAAMDWLAEISPAHET